MTVKYTLLSEIKDLQGTTLQVCNDERPNLSVLQYKASGSLLYSHERGMYSEDNRKQVTQIRQFLQLADKHSTDLVIAPEASVPLEVIHEIIDGHNLRPERGKLWCLGAEGIAKQDYKELIDAWSKKEDIIFIHSKAIDWRKHVNTAFYFFLTENEQLVVVLQAKTGAMRDISFEHEQADLSVGEEIFILDLNGGEKAQNVLATLICADILNVNAVEFSVNFHEKYPIILNIQMNAKPFHGKIINFREIFFGDDNIRNGQMIVANWGKGTTIRVGASAQKPSVHSDSGSGIFLSLNNNHGEDTVDNLLQNADFVIKGIGEAQKSGLEFFLSESYEVWKLQENIEVANYELRKGYRKKIGHSIMIRQYFPYVVHKYNYNDRNELEENSGLTCDCSEMKALLLDVGNRASEEIRTCAEQDCKNCLRFYVDALISLCLDEKIKDEFMVKDGKSQRTVQALYQDSIADEKKTMLHNLVDGMEKIKFPERFGVFNDNRDFYFKINHNAAERGGNNIYNLEVKCEKTTKRVLVVYLNNKNLAEVRERYTKIRKKIDEDRQDDIIIYYADHEGVHVYEEPYGQESILPYNNSFSQNIESFT